MRLRTIDRLPPDGEPARSSAPMAPMAPPAVAAGARARSPTDEAPSGDVFRIDSRQLFAGSAEVQIDHDGVLYRLKRTALGKLILTK